MCRNRKAIIAALSVALILGVGFVACYSTQYELIFINKSSNTGDACVYQHDPDMETYDVMSLAWFAKGAAPTTTVIFHWTIDYSFVWDETGDLVPGVVFEASQMWGADPYGVNGVRLTMAAPDIYTFADLKMQGEEGNLYIYGDRSLPVKEAAVGIGMAGAPYVVRLAQPNWEWVYTPKPMYWITFGSFEPGEVLDIESISNKHVIHFDRGVTSMTAIFNYDNTWDVFKTPGN